ncbi:MAG TPA: ATP-binding cassette domain-containing protein, partial [Acidimicrobiales bacterium]|nr:ATP-binding cassette domain-containing protein [Acidimicrobiales bacterium]
MSPPPLTVRLRDVVAFAGRYPVLAGVNLDVTEGEILALRGANGAGKTSLLRAMAGLLPLASGEASVLGLDPTADARVLRPLVGLLGHRNGLYDDLSAEDNVLFAARGARRSRSSRGAKSVTPGAGRDSVAASSAALEHLGITGRLRSLPVSRLSAGQRRRVALAALLARQPRLFLLDEPHAGLDDEHRGLLDGVLVEIASQGGTVVLASHDAGTASALAARVVGMAGGTVLGDFLDPTVDPWLGGSANDLAPIAADMRM